MTISNFDDVIDSRDVIERIEELTESIADDIGIDFENFADMGAFLTMAKDHDDIDPEELEELQTLVDLQEEAEGSPDWEHGEALIRESYFQDYAQELAEDCGMVPETNQWPLYCIDWERAARELKMDYTSVDFDGIEYLIRS